MRTLLRLLPALALAASTLTLAPAASAETVPVSTTTTLSIPERVGVAGESLYLDGEVTASDGSFIQAGDLYLEFKPAGKSWNELKKSDCRATDCFGSLAFKTNGTYRLHFTGGTYTSGATVYEYSESYSNEVKVAALRNIKYENVGTRTVKLKTKISPDFKNKTFTIEVKKNGKWVTYKKPKTDKNGVNVTGLAAKRGSNTYYRIIVPGSALYTKTASAEFYTYTY